MLEGKHTEEEESQLAPPGWSEGTSEPRGKEDERSLRPPHPSLVVSNNHWNDNNQQESDDYQRNDHLHLHVSPPHPPVQLFGSATEGRRVVR